MRIIVEKITMKLFNFLSKKAGDWEIWLQRPQSSLIMKIYFFVISFLEKFKIQW